MTTSTITAAMAWAILPEIGLLVLGLLVLGLDLVWPEERRRNLGWITAGGLVLILILSLSFALPGSEASLIWGGMLRQDWLGFVFRILFLLGAALTSLFAMDIRGVGDKGEFYLLMLTSTLGMCLMAGSADLVMLFLAIETTSIPLYALAGFLIRDGKSPESGFKYLLFGSTASAVMLYGFSLLYGLTGSTQIYTLAASLQAGQVPIGMLLIVLGLVLVGFSFKASLAPFHFWAPDVYEGAPTPVAGFLSTASKAAGFAVLMRVLMAVFPVEMGSLNGIIAMLAVASMVVGNVLALTQRNIKRLLAYSSIAQAGYMVIGVAAAVGSGLGLAGTTYYLVAYLLTNLAAFGVVAIVSSQSGGDEISRYSGLSRRSPGLALALLVALLSLGGVPPFAGFAAKVMVFASAIEAGMVWLAVVGILNSVVGLYYYLLILKTIYLNPVPEGYASVSLARPASIALAVCVFGVILLGTVYGPLFSWSQAAAAALH